MERALSPKADNVWKNSNTCQCCHHMWSLMWLRCPSPKGIKKEVFRGLVDRGVRVMVFLAKFPWKLFWAINTFEFTRDSWERLSKHWKKKKNETWILQTNHKLVTDYSKTQRRAKATKKLELKLERKPTNPSMDHWHIYQRSVRKVIRKQDGWRATTGVPPPGAQERQAKNFLSGRKRKVKGTW